MTENEAIKWLREMQNPLISEAELYCAETYYGSGKMVYPEPEDYVFETAIQALEEIQQYRAIGTIEEFKALKEKNEPKKAIGSKKYSEARCPICGSVISEDEFWALEEYARHCESCGQVVKGIDWSE